MVLLAFLGNAAAGAARGRPSAETVVGTVAAAGGEGSRAQSNAAGAGPGPDRAARGVGIKMSIE